MSSEQPRRAREGGAGGSPIGSTAAIIIAVVAVVGGFLILKKINNDDSSSDGTISPGITTGSTLAPGDTSGGTPTTLDPTLTLPPESTLPPTPTTAPAITTGATIVVANASTVDGAAGRFTTALKAKEFTTGEPVTASVKLPVSVVYYDQADANALAVATYLASLLGNISVEPLPSPPPVKDGTLAAGVTVLLMLGSDKADKTLEQAGAPTTTTIPAAGVTTTT